MTNLVEFPGLGISLEVNRVAFHLFGIPIYWYGVLIGIGMVLALVVAFRLAPKYGIDTDRMIDVIFIGFVLAIVCGRLYYVLFVDTQYRSFFELIDLRSGGIAIYGGIIGAFLGAFIGCKWRKVPMLPMFDIVGMGFLIGQALGRWGNFFNQEAFGSNTWNVFRMISPATTAYLQYNQAALVEKGIMVDPYAPVHPTFLYESAWCLLGFVLLLLYQKHRRFHGEIFLMYIFWYGAGRAVIEGLRTDPLMIGSFRVSQVLAIVTAVVAAVIWAILRWRSRGVPLAIPAIPPRTARVRIEGESGPQTVTISWPANEKAPDKTQQRAIALELLKAEGGDQDKRTKTTATEIGLPTTDDVTRAGDDWPGGTPEVESGKIATSAGETVMDVDGSATSDAPENEDAGDEADD